MLFDFLLPPAPPGQRSAGALTLGSQTIAIHFVRNPKARRYILRLQPDGSLRATVPRGGANQTAQEFAERNRDWIARQLQKLQQQPVRPRAWQQSTALLYRGETVTLQISPHPTGPRATFADQSVRVPSTADVRPAVEQHLWRVATRELTAQTTALAHYHKIHIQRITVRNQRTRWGSCSRRGTISLNWRLIQAPAFVQEYIILHELMHRREANHSHRYWQQVAAVCPEYEQAEAWLKQHRELLR